MREELFSYYVELGHSLCYERMYYISARRIGNVYSGFLLLASAGGIVTLSIWDYAPVLWAVIAMLAQVFQVLQPLTQASRQRSALKYMIQENEILLDEVCTYWNDIGSYELSDEQEAITRLKITEWKQRERSARDRFAGDIDFPEKNRLDKKAQKANRRYFWYNYNVDIEEEL